MSLLPGPLRAVLALLALTANTLFWGVAVFVLIGAKLVVPHAGWRRRCTQVLERVAELWIGGNNAGWRALYDIQWELQGFDGLRMDRSYLVNCNHQTWADVPVLQYAFHRRIPFMRFFLKRQLIWVPILGQAWWALEFPFMKRYSRETLARHPELRGTDLVTTRRFCEKLRGSPVAVINFLEGTRFTAEKHRDQDSPYRHLLRPRAGGIAFVLGAMGDQFDAMLDVTIAYPGTTPSLWALLTGQVPRIVVCVRRVPLPDRLCTGNYAEDAVFREEFQAWVRTLWTEKDALLDELLPDAA